MKKSFHHILFCSVFIALLGSDICFAQGTTAPSTKSLEPRVDFSFRPGSERTIGVTEFWIPLRQDVHNGEVVYGDFRIMDDNQDNFEFNAGVGYRHSFGDYILGGHGWYDRRLTQSGNAFNQITVGGEYFSDTWDGKINAYFPLNKKETFTRANPNGAGTGFVGNQVIVNTDQTVDEEALIGFDIELGRRISFMDDYTDSTRAYVAGFHFQGDQANNVSGWRTRLTSDINENIQIGARFQRDNVRGSQGFLEATFRLPFGRKTSYKDHGLWARMDESPERDIDIVSNEAILDDGVGAVLLNQDTGITQNIIHVDNSAAGGGTGTNEARFNTLADAQAIAGANDIIYVHRGLGTTTNQDSGITLDDPGQMLIGAGSGLGFDGSRFGTSNGANINGAAATIIAPTAAPIITNNGGQGVQILSTNNVFVSGITIDGTTGNGINLSNTSDVVLENITIQNPGANGIIADFNDNRTYDFNINNVHIKNSSGHGIYIRTDNMTDVDVSISNNRIENSGSNGISSQLRGNSSGNFTYENNITQYSNGVNLRFETLNNSSGDIIMRDNFADGTNLFMGLLVRAGQDSTITDAIIENNTILNSDSQGIEIDLFNGITSKIENSLIKGNTLADNGEQSIRVLGTLGNGFIKSKIIGNNVTNAQEGIVLHTLADTSVSASVENNLSTNNDTGILILDRSSGSIIADLGGGTLGSTGQNQVFNNTSALTVDMDGETLKAENNWWGNATGLNPSDVSLIDGSNVDASPYLSQRPQ